MTDKTKHVYAGILISIVTSLLIFFVTDWHEAICGTIGFFTAVLIGLGKEFVYDKWLGKGTFDWMDFLATLYGSIVGTIITTVILHFL